MQVWDTSAFSRLRHTSGTHTKTPVDTLRALCGPTSLSALGTNAGLSITGPRSSSLSSSVVYSELSSEPCREGEGWQASKRDVPWGRQGSAAGRNEGRKVCQATWHGLAHLLCLLAGNCCICLCCQLPCADCLTAYGNGLLILIFLLLKLVLLLCPVLLARRRGCRAAAPTAARWSALSILPLLLLWRALAPPLHHHCFGWSTPSCQPLPLRQARQARVGAW